MSQIVTLTLNPALDKSASVDHVVAERKLRCGQPRFDPGGGGINVARAITKLEGNALAVWTCGGPTGQLLREQLDEEGVSHRPIKSQAYTRENLVIFEESSHRQFRFGMPGAHLTEDEVDRCIEELTSFDPPPGYLVLSGSLPPGVDPNLYARIAGRISKECRVILDTSGESLKLGLDSNLFLIKPNVRELGQLVGKTIVDDDHIHDVASRLIDSGKVEVVLTSLGSAGAILTSKEVHEHIRAPTVEIRSKIGAGDSTVAGITLALSRGESLANAARYGIAAGAAAVMTDGTELCIKSDVDHLYQKMLI